MAQGVYVILEHIDDEKFYKFPVTNADIARVNRLYSEAEREEFGDFVVVYEVMKRVKGIHHELPLFHETDECFMDHWTRATEDFEDKTKFVVVSPLAWKENSPGK